jgi:hypothetical protein
MSLLSASPSTRNRTTPGGKRSALRPHGAPRLQLVQGRRRSASASVRRSPSVAGSFGPEVGAPNRPGVPSARIAAPFGRPAACARRPSGSARLVVVPDRPALRLTRRGRFVVRIATGGLVLLAVLVGVLLLDRTAQAGSQSHPVPVGYHVVLPGETLWQIAGEVAPRSDRRDTVAKILDLNALSTAAVSPGQRIAVPMTPSR